MCGQFGQLRTLPKFLFGDQSTSDGGQLFVARTALVASLRLRPKFHVFDLPLYLLQSWLYNI